MAGYIGKRPTSTEFVTNTFVGDGALTTFTLSETPAGNTSVLIHIDGVKQFGSAYNIVGLSLTFTGVPANGANIEVIHLGVRRSVNSTNAVNVTNTPAGNIAATNVQSAINELDVEKVNTSELGTGANQVVQLDATAKLPAVDGSQLTNTGKILQVIQNHVTTISSQATTANVRADIVGLTASITPSSTTSRIRISVRWQGEGSNTNNQDTVFGVRGGGVDIGNPTAAGVRGVGISGISQGFWNSDAGSSQDSTIYSYIDAPATTGVITYTATFMDTVTQTLYNNRTVGDVNLAGYERLTSSITLEEIGA